MNLNKSKEYFDPDLLDKEIHIIGCGAVGSTIAENLARLGVNKFYLYDFDTVTSHNIANQMFLEHQIGQEKITAVSEILKQINSDITIIPHTEGWIADKSRLAGYVFICVDNIETRKEILKTNLYNPTVKAFFDGRMRLTDAQHFASSWETDEQKKALLDTMNFTNEEAALDTPVSACGTTLSVCYTVRLLSALIVANFVKKATTDKLFKFVTLDAETFLIDAFEER